MAEELGKIIRMAGVLLKHAVGVMMLCWRRMLRAGALAGAIGIVVAEIAAILITHSPYPGWPAQLVAAAFGFSLAYAVALTVFVEEFIRGVIDMVRQLEGDAAGAARATAHLAERELGEVHLGIQHMLGVAAPLAWAGAQMKSARANAQKRQAERQRAEAVRAAQRARDAEAARQRAVAEGQRRAAERKVAEEAARQRAEAEAKRKAEEAQQRAQQEAARKQAQAEAQQKAEAERQRRDAERKQAEEAERQRRAEEAKRRAALEEGRRQAQEEARQRAEAVRKQQAEDAERARQLQEEERTQRAAAAAASLSAAAGAFTAAVRLPHDQHEQLAAAASTDEQPTDEAEDINLASVTQTPYTPMAPVPASSLPRIEWSYEHPAIKLPKENNGASQPAAQSANQTQQEALGAAADTSADAEHADDPDATFRRAVAAMRSPDTSAESGQVNAMQGNPSQPVVTPRPGASYPQTPPPPRLQPVEEPVPVLPMGQPAANADALEAPTQPARQRGDTHPAQQTQPETQPETQPAQSLQPAQSVGANGQGVRDPAQTTPTPNGKRKSVPITQPINAVTRPLPAMSRPLAANGNSGLWERLSQALVGKPPTASRPLAQQTQQRADDDNPLGNIRSLPPLPTEGLDDDETTQ